MLAIILLLTALTVALFVLTLMQLRPGRSRGDGTARSSCRPAAIRHDTPARRRRQAKSERLKGVLQALGEGSGGRQGHLGASGSG